MPGQIRHRNGSKSVLRGALVGFGAAVMALVVAAVIIVNSPISFGSTTIRQMQMASVNQLTEQQIDNARLIIGIGRGGDFDDRAIRIALMTALQESSLRNLDAGDRDSVGLFQQRPSQGWGSEEEIMDPVYSTNAFYDALIQVDGYEAGDINDIAQEVQRSGHPEAYRDHETEGRLYASALTGMSGANLHCVLGPVGSTSSPEAVRSELARQFPRLTESGQLTSQLADAGSNAPQLPADAGATALVIDPGGEETLGWTVANWAVARAAEDGVVQVSYAGRVWDRAASGDEEQSWSEAAGGAEGRVVVLVSGR